MTTMRVPVASLALVLDLAPAAEVTGASIDGDTLVLDLSVVGLAFTVVAGDELVGTYRIDVDGHRHFSGFRAPEPADTPPVPDDVVDATPPPAKARRVRKDSA